MARKIGESTAARIITDDRTPSGFFNGLRCPACGEFMQVVFIFREE